MVAPGSTFSAIWILVANSWMDTPAGHRIVLHDGLWRAEIIDPFAKDAGQAVRPIYFPIELDVSVTEIRFASRHGTRVETRNLLDTGA
jgi:hypothetical protein